MKRKATEKLGSGEGATLDQSVKSRYVNQLARALGAFKLSSLKASGEEESEKMGENGA